MSPESSQPASDDDAIEDRPASDSSALWRLSSEDLPESAMLPDGATREFDDAADSIASLSVMESGSAPQHQAKGANASSKHTPNPDLPEQIGDYRIKKLIGAGGMGQVYLAEHVRMQRLVAVKMLRGDRIRDSASVERFYDEVRAASRVMHPNVVTAFDAGEHESIHYLVMEYVEGMTLTRFVSKNGPLTPGMAAAMIRQAALGLLHAHRTGIVHRDVKPGNLIRANDGTIKLLDLGLAQISNVLWSDDGREIGRIQDPGSFHKRKGKLVGTLAYMSPEQLERPDEVDPRSDIYSLGAVMYFLLIGKPPYQGEYLDQVYGHRHGDVPDLMQLRDDVDLGFANILRRMMAKKLSERYGSLDEVIEDLANYAEESHSPAWLSEFVQRQSSIDASTLSGSSTAIANLPIFGMDLGMTYIATAEAIPGMGIHNLSAGADGQPLYRLSIANGDYGILYDVDANQTRMAMPRRVVHCLPMYIGKDVVEREVAGRKCPPEVLIAMSIRRAIANSYPNDDLPKLTAVSVPASYDQFHRRSIKQACRLAGLDSVRLVDRNLAAVQSLLSAVDMGVSDEDPPLDLNAKETILFVGLSGQATEVALIDRDGTQLRQLATAGHWHNGMLTWQHRLVELASEAFRNQHGFDPRRKSITASRLQMSCERALQSLLLLPDVNVSIEFEEQLYSISVSRDRWLEHCSDLIHGIRQDMHQVCKASGVHPKKIDTAVTLGSLLKIVPLRKRLFNRLPNEMPVRVTDRSDIARGAAASLEAELPQRTQVLVPPKSVAGQSIGIVIEDSNRRRRILPIIKRGERLPARTNRKLSIAKERESMTLSVVESSGIRSESWHSLGRYTFEVERQADGQVKRTWMVAFELNVDGLLTVRAQTPGSPNSKRLTVIPEPTLPLKDETEWTRWMAANE
ncbi:protein kinase domain-containing protein [Roseiconus lacunae]|uniref:Hsp70 family protein n=1 Tax=Roseiconus lacunae TaxID=2605694 RepID=A0ABT7PL05_9BACT|nr:Hsp70 family protein [Roseiconus lacunae]MCD0460795.1 Hsp70 family protein [Roseiconus lacunae]MDM4017148.1 Hsp70 family protein [Roseiconus lacunae]WRQ51274.1 Hsp70 family protein [Stieleria sp. HD01]